MSLRQVTKQKVQRKRYWQQGCLNQCLGKACPSLPETCVAVATDVWSVRGYGLGAQSRLRGRIPTVEPWKPWDGAFVSADADADDDREAEVHGLAAKIAASSVAEGLGRSA